MLYFAFFKITDKTVKFKFIVVVTKYCHDTSYLKSYLALLPSSISSSMSSKDVTANLDKSSTYGPNNGCSLTLKLPLLFGFNRSLTRSQ